MNSETKSDRQAIEGKVNKVTEMDMEELSKTP